MDSTQFNILDKKMDILIGLLAQSVTKGQTLQDRVKLLDSLGMRQKDIAKILDKTEKNISTNLLRIRKQKRKEGNG